MVLGLAGGLAAIVGALAGTTVPGSAAATPAAAQAVAAAGVGLGLLGGVGASLVLAWRRCGTAAMFAAAAGLALTGFAVPAGLALLIAAVLVPPEPA